jgi:hypothetical protein
MTPGINNKHLGGARISTFWTEGLADGTPRDIGQWLMSLSAASTVSRDVQNGIRRMVGLTEQLLENQAIPFKTSDVVQIGADLQQRLLAKVGTPEGSFYVLRRPPSYQLPPAGAAPLLNENYETITNEAGDVILTFVEPGESATFAGHASMLSPRYVIPFPAGVFPSVIRSDLGDLAVGLDFTIGEQCLVFNELPGKLFPQNFMLVLGAESSTCAPLSFTWQVDDLKTPGLHIAHYLRQSQSFSAFRLACLEVAGIRLLPREGILQDIKTAGGTSHYIFEDFVIEASYPHTALEIGTFYPKNHPIGDAVQLFGPTGGAWWRVLDWSQGLSMDELCPFKGLVIPDQRVGFGWTGGEFFPIQGDGVSRTRYWEHVRQAELTTGHQWTDAVADGSYLNPIDVFFQHLLGSRAVLVRLDPDSLGKPATNRLLEFIQRERPIGSVVITSTQNLAAI